MGRGLRRCWGRPDRPFSLLWRRLRARARRSENPYFPTFSYGEGNFGNFLPAPDPGAATAGAEGRAGPSSSSACGRPVSAPRR